MEERDALIVDALAVILGWALKLNEVAGNDPLDESAYPMATWRELMGRADALGVEVTGEQAAEIEAMLLEPAREEGL